MSENQQDMDQQKKAAEIPVTQDDIQPAKLTLAGQKPTESKPPEVKPAGLTQAEPEKVICPNCHHENDPNLTRCERCNTELVKTMRVPEIEITRPSTSRFPDVPQVDVTPEALTMLVSGYKTPIVVERKRELVMGRRVPEHATPDIDLANYNAYKMGVSRRHAVLRCSEDGCAIEDQASANATWVNENKLTPFVPYLLQSGDTIRLGHLVMYIYFSTVESVYLFETATETPRKLTSAYLMETVGPYLQALTDLQNLVNLALEREPEDITIGGIRLDATDAVQVTLRKATEAVNLVLRRIMPWKDEHKTPTTEEYQRLIAVVLERINADMPEEDREAYTKKLLPVLRALVSNPLSIAEQPPKKR
jgi:hypothetical protein